MKRDNINASKMKQYLNSGEACLLDLSIGPVVAYNGHYYYLENGNGNERSYRRMKKDFLVDAMYISYKRVDSLKTSQ